MDSNTRIDRPTRGLQRFSCIICLAVANLGFSLIAANSASAATYYLDASADPGGDGTSWANAWDELSDFDPDTLIGGDVVEVNDGDYGSWSFNRNADGDANYVTIQAASGATPEIDGLIMSTGYLGGNYDAYVKFDGLNIINDDPNSGCVYLRGQSYVQFYNLTMSTVGAGTRANTNRRLFQMKAADGPPTQKCTNIYLENCELDGQSNTDFYTFGYGIYAASGAADDISIVDCNIHDVHWGIFHVGDNWLVDNTEIHNCRSDGILITSGNGVTIQDCTIHDCLTADEDGGQHVDLIQIQTPGGMSVSNVTIQRNTCYNSSDQGFLLQPTGTCSNLIVQNNLLWGANHDNPGEVSFLVKIGGNTGNIVFRNNTLCRVEDGADGKLRIANNSPQMVMGNICYGIYDDDRNSDPTNFGYNVFVNNISNTIASVPSNCVRPGSLLAFKTLFADYDASNFSLASGSAAISLCPQAYSAADDITGLDRDANPDAGCYEYVSSDPNNQPPVLDTIGDKSVNENSLLTFDVNATDPNGDSITYSASNLPTGATFSSQTFSWTPGYAQTGTYDVTFTASDGTDSDSEIVTITVGNVNRAPVLASIGAKSGDENSLLSFAISATDPDSDSITYSASNLPTGATFSSGSFSWTPGYAQAGSYNVTFTASDGTDSDSEVIAITVSNVNRAPVLASIGNKSVNEGAGLSFSTSATDADSDSITYSASNLPTGATFSSGSFNWTPGYAQAGSYNVTFTASDGTDTHSETITVTVSNVNRTPVLTAIGGQSIDEGSLLSFSLTATDADGDSITYSVDTLPSGSAFTGQSFTWTPGYAMAGIYNVTFAASDGAAQDSETVAITVNNTNRAPVLDAIADQSVSETVLLTFPISATDADGDTLAYSASSLPTGAALSGQTFAWTPSHSQADLSYQITFTVSDGYLTDSQEVTLTVSDTSAPTVTSRSPAADSIQAPLNSLISLHVADDGKGVDAATVTITLEGNVIYTGNTPNYVSATGNCRRTGASADYVYAYQPNEAFDFDQTKAVTVNASDLGSNAMTEVSYSFRTEMRSFGTNKRLGSDIEDLDKASPATDSDSSGNIWAVWHAGAAGSRDVYIAKLTAGASAFGASTKITTSSADQCNPAIALGTDDKLYVAWQDNRNGDWDIYASTSMNGTTWTTKRRIADSNDNQINPALAIDSQATNRAHLVWQDDRSGNQDIYIAVSSNAFLTNTISQITSNTSDQTSPAIAIDSSDTAHVVWTDARNATTDIYGASAGSWTNVPIVNKSANQSSPAIAAESTGSILHFVWVDPISGNSDIYYASSDGMPSSPLAGTNLIDDNTNAEQLSPALAVTGSSGDNLHVFASWQDSRNADTDLYIVQANAANRTNVLVGDASSNSAQSEPAIGLDQYNQPYLVWTDGRGANNEIYYAASTFMQPTALTSQAVTTASGGTVGTDPNAITAADDVSVVVPAGACAYDVTISITKIENPPAFAVRRLNSYDFGPSGIEFSRPVTITIAYTVSASDNTPTAYWYDSLTGALSQQGITDVETVILSSTLHALRFKTTHFTAFYVAATAAAAVGGAGGGGGGGGGCSMSPDGQGNIVEFLVPYIALAAMMAILKRRDAKNRKAPNITKGDR